MKLEEERRHRQKLEKDKRKKRKKEKRGRRRHGSLPTESDEDIAPAQQVDIVTEEMPEVSPGAPSEREASPAMDGPCAPLLKGGSPVAVPHHGPSGPPHSPGLVDEAVEQCHVEAGCEGEALAAWVGSLATHGFICVPAECPAQRRGRQRP